MAIHHKFGELVNASLSREFEMEIKVRLAREVCALVHGWNQRDAAGLLALGQPDLSRLRRGRVAGIKTERLMRLIAAHGYNVTIRFDAIPKRFAPPKKQPQITVTRHNVYGRLFPVPNDLGGHYHIAPGTRDLSG